MTPTLGPRPSAIDAGDRHVRLQTVEPPGSPPRVVEARLTGVQGPLHTLAVDDPACVRDLDLAGLELAWERDGLPMSVPVRLRETDPAAGVIVVEIAERRSHMRVDSSLLFRLRPLTEGDYAELAARVLAQPLEYLEDSAEAEATLPASEVWDRMETVLSSFHRMLREISDRLDHLTALVEGHGQAPPAERQACVINISGAGLAFESTEPFAPGQKLWMTFDLSRFPYRTIQCLGEVTRAEARPDPPPGIAPHLVYVAFTHIREEDRDQIIRHVFRMQRRMLRHRHAA